MIWFIFFIQHLECQSLLQLEVCQDMKSLQQMSQRPFSLIKLRLFSYPGCNHRTPLFGLTLYKLIAWLFTFSRGANPPFHQLVGKYIIFILMTFSNHLTGVYIDIFGCGSKCKVWIKPRSHTRSRPPIQTSDPDLSKGFDPDLWSRPLEWYNVLVSWCLVHVIGFPALQLFTLLSSQATNCCKATLPSCQASKLHLS